jgi:hypothetical protein
MRPDFETGVMLGQTLATLKMHDTRLTDHDHRIEKVEGEITTAKAWAGRIATAGGLWAAGLGLSFKSNDIGAIIARMIKAAIN